MGLIQKVLATLLLSGLGGVAFAPAVLSIEGNERLSGIASVLDGDTIELAGVRIRIYGIDAPEGAQRCKGPKQEWLCGRAATRALERMTSGKTLSCAGRGVDDYGRLLAVCNVDRVDVGASLVRQGFAWAFVKYSKIYLDDERQAREARLGVFEVENVNPWDFRAARWEGARQTVESDRAPDCPIKGNINREGGRVYHLPWQASYPRTKINERTGERWFCSIAEAEKAGWHPAR